MLLTRQIINDWKKLMSCSEQNVWLSRMIFFENLNREHIIRFDYKSDLYIAMLQMLLHCRIVRDKYFR